MPKIKLSEGYINYHTVPLYRGVKIIDKEKSFENLKLLKKLLDSKQIEFQLAYGTLLGAIREGDFITHDEDIDLIILNEHKQALLDLLPLLKSFGFEVARYDRRGLLSLIRNDEYIDLYFFSKLDDKVRTCSGMLCPSTFIENTTTILFRGESFLAPSDYIGFFEFEYGKTWNTPIQWANFQPSKLHVFLMNIKMKLKDMLPDCLFFLLAKRAEIKLKQRYLPKIQLYFQHDK